MPWHPAGVFLGEKMDKIASALVKAQKAFGPALKTSTNPHFRSRYADLSACVEAVMDGLSANGIFFTQRVSPSDTGVLVETVFIHESGETFSCGQIHVPATKHDAQGFGSALTYARRYSLMAACGIAPEDDDGNAAVRKGPKPDIADWLAAIEATTTGEELQSVYKQAYEACQGHQDLIKRVIEAKAARVARAKQEKQA